MACSAHTELNGLTGLSQLGCLGLNSSCVAMERGAEGFHSNRACPLQRSGASASNSFSMKPGVDARVGHCGSVSERQRPV